MYQGIKRPLPFSVYLAALVVVLVPVSHWLSQAGGIWQLLGALFVLGGLIAALFGARAPILALEAGEAAIMAWVYRRSPVFGQMVYLGLMLVAAGLGGVILRYVGEVILQMLARDSLQASVLGLPMPSVLFLVGVAVSASVRLQHHPLRGQLDIWGRVRVHAETDPEQTETDR